MRKKEKLSNFTLGDLFGETVEGHSENVIFSMYLAAHQHKWYQQMELEALSQSASHVSGGVFGWWPPIA